MRWGGGVCFMTGGGAEAAEPGGHWGHVPPHFSPQSMKCPTSTGVHARPNVSGRSAQRGNKKFSPQSMKCPTSTGVHARPTMYQEGVPRGAITKFLPRV